MRAVPGDRRAGRPSATHGGPSNEEGRRCAEPDPGRFLRRAARDSNPEPFALRVLVRGFLDLRRFIDVGSDLGVWLPLLSAVDPRLPVVRGPSAAPVYGMRRRGRRLGSRAVQARLTVGSLAPSASAQEAADQPKPNRYDDDIGKQCCLRHLSWVLLGCQRMSPIAHGPGPIGPSTSFWRMNGMGRPCSSPLIGRAPWNAARQKQRTEYEDGSQRPQHDDALHRPTLRPTAQSYETGLSARARRGHGRRERTWLRRCGDGHQLGRWGEARPR